MGHSDDPEHEPKGLSTPQVILMFLAGVAVCAVFFSAGFLVGYNERQSKATPLTERVTGPSETPPVVSQDPSPSKSDTARTAREEQPPTVATIHPEPLRPQPLIPATDHPPGSATKPASDSQKPSAISLAQPDVSTKSGAGAKPDTLTLPALPASDASTAFIIQVAATSTKPDAEKMVIALRSLNYPVNLVTPEQAHAGDNLFRVQVGPYATRDTAEKAKTKLMLDGFKQPFIKH